MLRQMNARSTPAFAPCPFLRNGSVNIDLAEVVFFATRFNLSVVRKR
jgi:hypothetical protein